MGYERVELIDTTDSGTAPRKPAGTPLCSASKHF